MKMFDVKPLARKQTVRFEIKPLVKKNLSPVQERSSYINMMLGQGKSYAQAIRAFDAKARTANA
jgi:hypothetical protein